MGNEVLQNMPFIAADAERTKTLQDRRDAAIMLKNEGKSGNFILCRLVEMYAPDWRERFGPVKNIRVTRTRIGVGGKKQMVEVNVVDEYVFFDWDVQTGQHIAAFYDDDEGYNRRLLSTHFYNGLFEIMDEAIRADIGEMAKKLKDSAVAPVYEEDKPLTEDDVLGFSIEAIDDQMSALAKQRDVLLARNASAGSAPQPQREHVHESSPVLNNKPDQAPAPKDSENEPKPNKPERKKAARNKKSPVLL